MFLMAVSIAIIVMPGMLLVNISAHETYHVVNHKDYAEKVYFDLNSKTLARTIIEFPNSTANNLTKEAIKKEEVKANTFGNITGVLYLILATLLIVWITSFLNRYKKK